MGKSKVTGEVLRRTIDVGTIISEARGKFDAEMMRKLSVSEWLVRALPWAVLAANIVFFFMSAPHTINMLRNILPDLIAVAAPLGIELFILPISALIFLGWKNTLTLSMLFMLIGIAITINIGGSLTAVIHGSGAAVESATLEQLIGMLGSLPAEKQILFVVAVLLGVCIPLLNKLTGEAIVRIATGDVKLNTTNLDELWAKEELVKVRGALYSAALRQGASSYLAGDYAEKVSRQMCGEAYTKVVAVTSNPMPTNPSSKGVVAEHRSMGFVPEQRVSITQDEAKKWLSSPENAEAVMHIQSLPGGVTAKCRMIAAMMREGDEAGYRSVMRANDVLNVL